MPQTAAKTDGAQAIRRASAILKFLSLTPATGATLGQVCESTELSRSTAHRMLRCLVQEGFVSQSDDARYYRIGAVIPELALAARIWDDEILNWRPVLQQVSAETGVTVYLMGRSGNESVCLDKVEGASIVRVIPVEVGQRRPLGVGAGAAALLASLPEEDCERTIAAIGPHLGRFSTLTVPRLRDILRKARATGFAESHAYVAAGVYGLAIAATSGGQPARLALSLAAHESLAKRERILAWKECLSNAVRKFRSAA